MTDTLYRSCPTCEASCGLAIEVAPDRSKVLRIRGDKDDPRSRGYVCAKSQAFHHIYQDPERLRRPMRREGDSWTEVSWEEALNEIAKRLTEVREKHGKDAIAMYYGNPNGHNFHTQIYTQLFIQMLDTERFFSAGSVDQQPKNLSNELLYGNAWLFAVPDLSRTDFFVCMGANPLVSQGSLMGAADVGGYIKAIRRRGGKMIVVDPRRTETADLADTHIAIRPGTDALLLLAWVNELFRTERVDLGPLADRTEGVEELRTLCADFSPESVASATGVSASSLRGLITGFASAQRPVLYGRIGLCTQAHGTLASWLVDVINLLQGRLDAEGGAMFARPATGQNEPRGVAPLQHGRWHSRARGFPEYMSMLPASCMAEELELAGEEEVKAMITVAGNPVLSVPNGQRIDAALAEIDFMVALDFYINETTRHADFILPSTTQLEHSNYDFLFSAFAQRNVAYYSPQVLPAADDSLSQAEILLELVAGMNGMLSADLETLMLEGMVDSVLASPAFETVSTEQVLSLTDQYEKGERLLDILLRAGPYGAGFAGDDGLTLKQVKNAPHGVDIGPLQAGILPELLNTEGKKIVLLHPLLRSDIDRLHALLSSEPAELLLIGRRHIRDMNSWLHNLDSFTRGRNRCTLMMHPDDAAARNLADAQDVLVTSRVGELTVPVEFNSGLMPGVVSLPHGFGHRYTGTAQSVASRRCPGVSANDLVDDEVLDRPSGTSVVNGVPVAVSSIE